MQRSEPLVIFGIYPGTCNSNKNITVRNGQKRACFFVFFPGVLNFEWKQQWLMNVLQL